MNEALQWAALVVILLLLLGVLRQVGFLLSPPHERAFFANGPPIGARLPRSLLEAIQGVSASLVAGASVAFVTENCAGCQKLLASLTSKDADLDSTLILVARTPSPTFKDAIGALGVPVVIDDRGDIWQSCDVHTTPLIVKVDADGRVLGEGVTHRVDAVAALGEGRQGTTSSSRHLLNH